MKKLLCLGYLVFMQALAGADIIDNEATLTLAKSQGRAVYYSCITTPPTSSAQVKACQGLYSKYTATLGVLNAPYPLTKSSDPDPYIKSSYSICSTETGHMLFGDQGAVPYCPTKGGI